MLRAFGAVVGGYAVMFVFVFVSFSCAYLAMGADRAFRPGSYDVSTMWLVTSTVLGLAGAAAGGLVCSLIARRGSKAPIVLAGLLLALGLLMAVPALRSENAPREVRTAGVGNIEAMGKAKTPVIAALLNPLVGAVGVVAGARLRKPRAAGSGA